jgi:DNA-binding transcriptional ArsR family regulator
VDLVDSLVALHHPVRRRLLESLGAGPATVGELAERLGLAAGSVSHHLKPLHATGFVEPVPELAPDRRHSCWRAVPKSVSYDSTALPEGSAAREVLEVAERANDDWHVAAIREWRAGRGSFPRRWQNAATSWDTLVSATPDQLEDLAGRMQALLTQWARECRDDHDARPDAERRPVYVIARANPVHR